ncbi:copper chaperone PCu(A)C [Undibacterium sp.]|jgi:copper(I)-binding protein|uniref:copper chaperone PCu(A)C n=1 Tax=Undibacterium sp. TaxID=1914977 RepID=UPI002C72CCB2|nr:copper chaperone PCu(A)C [Undibacterium sp.]HTD05439.1 copper chaperone PCu(A)C [Undibacterium sp.]
MKTALKLLLTGGLLAASLGAHAEAIVKDAWVRATVPQQKATGAFMKIQVPHDARLIEVQTPAAATAEVHEMKMENDVMKMRAIRGLELPAGKEVELKPGSYHVMLMGLKAQVKEGDIVPLTLIIEGKDKKRETIEVKAKARPLNSAEGKM